uniref:Putative regulation of interferon-beta production n=1 Tax=Ixodes ricinus TaxID=34613 RepID=A0A131YB53_IXORI
MSGGTTYCVSGFGKGLDMRPMNFKDTVQKIRVCSLCNVIPNTVVLLPCSHSLCELCFDKCLEDGERCLLDQERLGQECVEKLTLSEEKLATWQVACWNTPYGCSFSGSSVGVLDHFEKHCTFHAVCCSRCDHYVLRSDVVGHLKSGCTALLTEDGPGTSSKRRVGTSVGDVGKAIGEMKDAVGKMTDEQLHLQSSLNELLESTHYQTAEITKVLEHIGEVRSSVLIGHETTEANCKEQILRLGDRLSSQMMDIARSVRQLRPRIIHWYLEGWEKIKEEALVKPFAYTESEVQTLYGYAVSQNIEMKKQDEQLRLHSFMRIHASQNDDDLEWPFKYDCRVGLIHPRAHSKILARVHANKPEHRENFKRPVGLRNTGLGSFLETVTSIESRGFIENDRLHLFVEIIP